MAIASGLERWWSPIGRVGEADVFHVDLSPHPAKEDAARVVLDEWELGKWCRFTNPGPRRRFTLCRAALRLVLCSKLGCDNHELEFGVSYYEKPFAIVRGKPHPIGFNVSHSGSHGLIGIASGGRMGVDVEDVDTGRKLELLTDTAFTPAEQSDLDSVEETERRRLFFRMWTIKEALIKGVGMGLSLDMTTFEVPVAMRRGASSGAFSFPQAPSVYWRLESIDNRDYCAAIAHEPDPT